MKTFYKVITGVYFLGIAMGILFSFFIKLWFFPNAEAELKQKKIITYCHPATLDTSGTTPMGGYFSLIW